LNVTKNEFVQNALRFAIMRGRQNKVIEKSQRAQVELETSIAESNTQIASLKEEQQSSLDEVERLKKLEQELVEKARVEREQRE